MPFHNDSPYGDGAWSEAAPGTHERLSQQQAQARAERAWQPPDPSGWVALLAALGVEAEALYQEGRLGGHHSGNAVRVVVGPPSHRLSIAPSPWREATVIEYGSEYRRLDRRGRVLGFSAQSTMRRPDDLVAALARIGITISPEAPPLVASVRDGWDPCDCYWCAEQGEWTRPEIPPR